MRRRPARDRVHAVDLERGEDDVPLAVPLDVQERIRDPDRHLVPHRGDRSFRRRSGRRARPEDRNCLEWNREPLPDRRPCCAHRAPRRLRRQHRVDLREQCLEKAGANVKETKVTPTFQSTGVEHALVVTLHRQQAGAAPLREERHPREPGRAAADRARRAARWPEPANSPSAARATSSSAG